MASKENSFAAMFPDLLSEWDYSRNREDPTMLLPQSNKKVWWVCDKGHGWETFLYNRTNRKNKGCPYCSGRRVTAANNLIAKYPYLIKEWDYDTNTIDPYTLSTQSNKKFWWLCKRGHSWKAAPYNRIKGGGCPKCNGNFDILEERSIKAKYPGLMEEWDHDKNTKPPDKVAYKSNKKVWWVCKSNHSWQSSPNNRVSLGRGCPYCSNQKVYDGNRLSIFYPSLVKEWDYNKNESTPEEHTTGSTKRVRWLCSECGFGWAALVSQRTRLGTGCPRCAYGKNKSVVSSRWLDIKGVPENNREYPIFIGEKKYIVDGFDPETNTVYEFLGDYWHGNPNIRRNEKINTRNGIKLVDLYNNTIVRLEELRVAGYTVVYIWEKDFTKQEKE